MTFWAALDSNFRTGRDLCNSQVTPAAEPAAHLSTIGA